MDKDCLIENGHKPLLIVIAGPNGSGKTSITAQLLRSDWMEDALYINPDIVAQEKFGDWNNPEAVINSAKYCEKLREKCLVKKKSLIFEIVMSAKDKVEFKKELKGLAISSEYSLYQQNLQQLTHHVLQTG